ncbi:MAG: lysophospholipid acyltransferase family protein [Patescibacteria group bacterium]|jgi:1-acyl-sn-glycerol-3-phosphate acyltransferase
MGFFFFRFPLNFTRVRGRKNIPKKGQCVLFVCNHISMYDSFLIGISAFFPSMLARPARPPINFAAKENFFTSWYISLFFRLLRTVPVEGRKDSKLFKLFQALIKKHNLLIFYQGGRSYDLTQIKDGPGYIIATADEPITVIPVYHDGIQRIFSRGGPKTHGIWRWLPRNFFRKPLVIFGPAIDFSEELKIPELREKIKAINRHITQSIQLLQSQNQKKLQT